MERNHHQFMANPPAEPRQAFNLTSQYDAFLFASIGGESGGMRLTVLSALARLDLDPWEEAARLAALPRRDAEKALVSILLQLPIYPSGAPESEFLAAQLVALLPTARLAPTAKEVRDTGGRAVRINFWLAWLCFEILLTVLAPHQRVQSVDPHGPAAAPSAPSSEEGFGTALPSSAQNSEPGPGDIGHAVSMVAQRRDIPLVTAPEGEP